MTLHSIKCALYFGSEGFVEDGYVTSAGAVLHCDCGAEIARLAAELAECGRVAGEALGTEPALQGNPAQGVVLALANWAKQLYEDIALLRAEVERLRAARVDLATENMDHERWLREMCEDYRLGADDHAVSRRIAINTLIHELRAEVERLRSELSAGAHVTAQQCDLARQAEIERNAARTEVERLKHLLDAASREEIELDKDKQVLMTGMNALRSDRDAARAQLDRQRAVIEAARERLAARIHFNETWTRTGTIGADCDKAYGRVLAADEAVMDAIRSLSATPHPTEGGE